jgi:circadian clock protein KaiB
VSRQAGKTRQETLNAFEAAEGASRRVRFVLRLYVAGTRSCSVRAIANIKRICERHLPGRYRLDVVDLYQQPALAKRDDVLAAPTLVRTEPGPICRIVGDLSDERRVLAGLGIRGAS